MTQWEQSTRRLLRRRSLTSSLTPSHRPSPPTRPLPHAHHSQGADVAKSNGKLRLLHVLGPFLIEVYSMVQTMGEQTGVSPTGSTASSVTSEGSRPERGGTGRHRYHRTPSTMLRTPLPPPLRPMRTLFSPHAAPEDHPVHDLFLQRQRNACIDVKAADGMIQARPP